MFVPDYRLEYIFSYTAHARLPPEIVGPVPDGVRAYVYVIRGEAHGPKVKGTFTPDRAEEVLVRKDGIVILDVRGTLQTDDGALIYLPYTGMGDLGPDGYEKFLRGELPPDGKRDVTTLARRAGISRAALYRSYPHLKAEFEQQLALRQAEPLDPLDTKRQQIMATP